MSDRVSSRPNHGVRSEPAGRPDPLHRALMGWLAALAFALVLVPLGCAPATPRPDRRLSEARHLSDAQRVSLSDEMKGHGDAMTDLVWAVLYLEHDQVGRVAAEIAEPGLGRARAEDDPLRTAFPETYFELERELLARSRELADTAATKDAAAIALAYGRVAETCVRCHAVYLDDRPAP